MPRHDWDERYFAGDTPWDTGEPDEHLVEFLRSSPVERSRALDAGCGTGTNALWLAEQGFAVLGIDVAPAGIEKARAKLAGPELDRLFETADFPSERVSGGPFDLRRRSPEHARPDNAIVVEIPVKARERPGAGRY